MYFNSANQSTFYVINDKYTFISFIYIVYFLHNAHVLLLCTPACLCVNTAHLQASHYVNSRMCCTCYNISFHPHIFYLLVDSCILTDLMHSLRKPAKLCI